MAIVIIPVVGAAEPSIASFTAAPTTGPAPLTVTFTDQSTGNPTGWAWFFGDETYTAPWTQVNANAGWSGRWGHSNVAMPDGSIVLMGGGFNNDVWRSTDNGATWTQMTPAAGWSARYYHSSVAMPDGSIVLMGGYSSDRNLKNDVWRSTDNGATWTQVNASAGWSARAGPSSVAMPDGSIVMMGGKDVYFKNDVWRSTDNGATWTQMTASAGWTARSDYSCVTMPDGSIVLMGGFDGVVYKNDVWRSTDNGATWMEVNASAGWSARYYHSSVAMPDGSIVLMGGAVSGVGSNAVWRSTDNGTTWMQLPNAGWSARWSHSSVAMPDGSIVLMGGGTAGGNTNDVWRFQPASSSAQNPTHTYTIPGVYTVQMVSRYPAASNPVAKTTITVLPPILYNLTGSWDLGGPAGVSGFGNCMALRQSGSQVTGNYTHEQGTVTGTVTGNTFLGVWAKAPAYTGETDSGKYVVTISSDGNSFSGTWGYGNASTGYAWNGTKSSAGCPLTPVTPLSVTAISPASGTNDGAVSATVTGTGFKPGAVVRLTLTGQPDIVASGVTLTGNSSLTCTFDLTGKATGIWDLAVTNPVDGTTSVRSTAFLLTNPHITDTINGTIIVSSTPQGALVYLDGFLKGTGSVILQDVSPGYHAVRVTKTMYNDYGTDVRVVAGSTSYVNAVLTPVSGTSGTIIASSNPAGANVYLDGMDKGISPVTITGVSSGPHTVSFTKTGYTAVSRPVTMTAGQTMDITVDLTKTGGEWSDLLNTTTLIIVGIIVLIIAIIGYLLRKKKNRWENY